MDAESNKILLIGIGNIGLEVIQIIRKNEVKGITTLDIDNESQLPLLDAQKIQEAELVILVADLGDKKYDALTLQTAKLVKENEKIVASFVTIPRLSEGEKKIMHALETAMELKSEVDASLIINKENCTNTPEVECTFAELIDSLVPDEERIAGGIQSMIDLISGYGAVNINLNDLKRALAQGGTFAIERGLGIGEDRIMDAIEMALSSPMMRTCDIFTSRKVLIKILTPKKTPMIMKEAKILSEFIDKFPPYAEVSSGMEEADDNDLLSVIILASGFDVKLPEK